jgi:tetratricopeptide (TPR) repeat protein
MVDMSVEHAHGSDAQAGLSPAAAERAVRLCREAHQSEKTLESRARLIEALAALAGQQHLLGDDAATAEALAEADALVPSPPPAEESWQARMMKLCLVKAGIAQSRNHHAEAVDLFEAALRHIPFEPGKGGRDVNAARLQLLVRMARSRRALGQAAEIAAETDQCDIVVLALEGKLPARALDTIRAAVLDNHGAALALLGDFAAAEKKFAASLDLLDRLGGAELADLRQHVRLSKAEACRALDRGAEETALPGCADGGTHVDVAHRHDDHAHHHDGAHGACSCAACSS